MLSDLYFEQVSVSCGVDIGLEDGSGLEGHVIKGDRSRTEAVSTMSGLAALGREWHLSPVCFLFGM